MFAGSRRDGGGGVALGLRCLSGFVGVELHCEWLRVVGFEVTALVRRRRVLGYWGDEGIMLFQRC